MDYIIGKVRSALRGIRSRLSVAWFLRALLTAAIVTVISISPIMRLGERSWISRDNIIEAIWLSEWAILATLASRAVDNLARERKHRKKMTKRSRHCDLTAVNALGLISKNLKHSQKPKPSFLGARERILQAIASKVAEIIDEDDETSIMVSLLDFSHTGQENGRISVVARSAATRKTPVHYDRAATVAWLAIDEGQA